MGWIVAGVWIGAACVAAVVLGFCAYELVWKARRLETDLERLGRLSETLTSLQVDIQAAQRRLSDVEL